MFLIGGQKTAEGVWLGATAAAALCEISQGCRCIMHNGELVANEFARGPNIIIVCAEGCGINRSHSICLLQSPSLPRVNTVLVVIASSNTHSLAPSFLPWPLLSSPLLAPPLLSSTDTVSVNSSSTRHSPQTPKQLATMPRRSMFFTSDCSF